METISSVIRSSRPVTGQLVERDIIVEVHAFGVEQARGEAIARFAREHPEATLAVISHTVLKRPSQGRTWTEHGTYQVTLRASGLLENLA
jgi:hypothetical protein